MSKELKISRPQPETLSPAESRAQLQAAIQKLDLILIERAVTTPEEDRPVIERVYAQWRSVTTATTEMRIAARRMKRTLRLP